MSHTAGLDGHARRTVACAFIPAFAALLMQCAHGRPGTAEPPPPLPPPPAAQTSVFADCADCPEMIALPGGGMALGRYEVTLEEYRAFAAAVPDAAEPRCGLLRSWRDPGFVQTGRHPVTCVSWNDAQAYVRWLSLETGHRYRLPTEAEWDRGAAGSPMGCSSIRNLAGTCAVGSYDASDAGLFDMVGNLWEWTDDCWDGDCGRRVLRGGSHASRSSELRPDARSWARPELNRSGIGFRVARTLPPNGGDSVETARGGSPTADETRPRGPDERIAKTNDGRATSPLEAERPVDLDTGAVAGVTARDADAGDATTTAETPATAAGQVDHVFVEVLDRAGRPVPGLTAADFSLQENNVDLDVVAVRRGTPRPMSIALLVDNGGRIAARAERDALRAALTAFLRTLPPRHEVSLHTLRGRLRRVVGATTDRGALDDAIGRVRVGARARVGLLDSVREVSEPRYEDDEPFPVVVLVLPNGDGDRGGAREDADLHMARLAAAGIRVHAVVLEPRSAAPGVARDLTRLLRGVYMTITSRAQLSLGLARLAARLADGYERMSMQYRVSYVHSGDEDAEIMVGVKRSGVDVRPLPQLQLH